MLLKGRAEAFGSRNERILKRKKEIKGARRRHWELYHLVYTRTPQGRAMLLKGRAEAFGSRNERILKRKKEIKGALE